MSRESYIEKRACRAAEDAGWLVRKLSNVKGDPDRLFVRSGRAVVIEFKKPGARPTKIQAHRLEEWRAAGAVVGAADSVERAMELLNNGA